jgi:hypothetical protein
VRPAKKLANFGVEAVTSTFARVTLDASADTLHGVVTKKRHLAGRRTFIPHPTRQSMVYSKLARRA